MYKRQLMGSDDTQVIRVEAGTLGTFDPKCVNYIVRVTGTLKEQRIDEAYIQNWEAQLKAQAAEMCIRDSIYIIVSPTRYCTMKTYAGNGIRTQKSVWTSTLPVPEFH